MREIAAVQQRHVILETADYQSASSLPYQSQQGLSLHEIAYNTCIFEDV